MVDAGGNIIPIVEDDQGEGYKDTWERYELINKTMISLDPPELFGKRDRKDEKTSRAAARWRPLDWFKDKYKQ